VERVTPEGECLQNRPTMRQREQTGRALEHLTLARKHPSQVARRRGFELPMGGDIALVCVEMNRIGSGRKVDRLRWCSQRGGWAESLLKDGWAGVCMSQL
jgi:hypothetical protein